MAQAATSHRVHRVRDKALHYAAGAGPLSLLLLPKCPLCLLPLLAFFGIALPSAAGLWVVAGILITGWFAILMFAARRQPIIRAAACIALADGVVAIGMHNRPLLWGAVLVMSIAGFALSRVCADRCGSTVIQPGG
ncbi:MAG: hypothetical protein ACXV5L_04955 [Thermoanaerobaculia bacterium]